MLGIYLNEERKTRMNLPSSNAYKMKSDHISSAIYMYLKSIVRNDDCFSTFLNREYNKACAKKYGTVKLL